MLSFVLLLSLVALSAASCPNVPTAQNFNPGAISSPRGVCGALILLLAAAKYLGTWYEVRHRVQETDDLRRRGRQPYVVRPGLLTRYAARSPRAPV